jgi:hypothetical protein
MTLLRLVSLCLTTLLCEGASAPQAAPYVTPSG